jgi:hypothetical protein
MSNVDDTADLPSAGASAPRSGGERDAAAAQEYAAVMLQKAADAAAAIEEFHTAADKIEAARSAEAQGTAARSAALSKMRANGLGVGQIAELTSLSVSRIQAILREDKL